MTVSNNLTCYRTKHEHTQPASSTSTQYSDALRTEANRTGDEGREEELRDWKLCLWCVVGGGGGLDGGGKRKSAVGDRAKQAQLRIALHIVSFRLPVLLLKLFTCVLGCTQGIQVTYVYP